MFPYLDLAGFKRRTSMAVAEVDYVETDNPGFTAQAIALESSYINGRLRKRYGNASSNTAAPWEAGMIQGTASGSSLPFGQSPPALLPAGTAPPGAMLTGRPTLGSVAIVAAIVTPGAMGTATIKISIDGGIAFGAPIVTAPQIAIVGTGMTLALQTNPAPVWNADNVYAAATPCPEVVLGWLTTLVTFKLYRKRGVNPQDPLIDILVKDVERVRAELQEAADSKDGLFDLPVSEDSDSAVTTGGPLSFSDASPYAWQDRQASRGYSEDAQQGAVLSPWWGW